MFVTSIDDKCNVGEKIDKDLFPFACKPNQVVPRGIGRAMEGISRTMALPVPTNMWYQNVLVGDAQISAPPYCYQINEHSLVFGTNNSSAGGWIAYNEFVNLDKLSGMTIIARYKLFRFIAVRGSISVTFVFEQAVPYHFGAQVSHFNGNVCSNDVFIETTCLAFTVISDQIEWLFCFDDEVNIRCSANGFTVQPCTEGVVLCGICVDAFPACIKRIDPSFIVDSYLIDHYLTAHIDSNYVKFQYTAVTPNGSNDVITSIYRGPLSPMDVNIGQRSEFELRCPVIPSGAELIDSAKKTIMDQAMSDITSANNNASTIDTSNFEKSVKHAYMSARLIMISASAEFMSVDILHQLKQYVTMLCSGKYQLRYDNTWGGLDVDGINLYDRPDLWNCLIYAIYVVCVFDKKFYTHYKRSVLAIIRNIVNPAQDSKFPTCRYKDWWTWKSGDHAFAPKNGDAQNFTTGHFIQCYLNIYRLGLIIENPHMSNVAMICLTTEIHAMHHSDFNLSSLSDLLYPNAYENLSFVPIEWIKHLIANKSSASLDTTTNRGVILTATLGGEMKIEDALSAISNNHSDWICSADYMWQVANIIGGNYIERLKSNTSDIEGDIKGEVEDNVESDVEVDTKSDTKSDIESGVESNIEGAD